MSEVAESRSRQTDPAVQMAHRHHILVWASHWLTALAVFIMIGSGWRIYDWNPIFVGTHIPHFLTLGGAVIRSREVHNEDGLAGALQWHFAGMWLLVASVGLYVGYGLASGHFRKKWRLIRRFRQITLGSKRVDQPRRRIEFLIGIHNLSYLLMTAVTGLMILSGLAIWKPVQLYELTWLFGGYDSAYIIHFAGMIVLLIFISMHVASVSLAPKVLLSMIAWRAHTKRIPK